jgi:hypothetical protein
MLAMASWASTPKPMICSIDIYCSRFWELLSFAPSRKNEATMRHRQESCVVFGVSSVDLGLSFNPFDAKTDPKAPVKKIVSVESSSINARSFGA